MEEILMGLAKAIEKGCSKNKCPCRINCNVMTDEECFERIIGWLKKVAEAESLEVKLYE